jgi:hypothetical protein
MSCPPRLSNLQTTDTLLHFINDFNTRHETIHPNIAFRPLIGNCIFVSPVRALGRHHCPPITIEEKKKTRHKTNSTIRKVEERVDTRSEMEDRLERARPAFGILYLWSLSGHLMHALNRHQIRYRPCRLATCGLGVLSTSALPYRDPGRTRLPLTQSGPCPRRPSTAY